MIKAAVVLIQNNDIRYICYAFLWLYILFYVMMTLQLLETCVKNCGKRFHIHIATKEFMQELIKVISPKYNPSVELQNTVLSLIQVISLYVYVILSTLFVCAWKTGKCSAEDVTNHIFQNTVVQGIFNVIHVLLNHQFC